MARSDGVNEARLELEYFPQLKRTLLEWFGAHRIEVLKPTPNREAYVGFDQGFVVGEDAQTISHDAFLRGLGDDLRKGVTVNERFHLAYFLQYKVVERMSRCTDPCPKSILAPYCRAKLSLLPSPQTGLSQHATLRRLRLLPGAEVYYACPMVFDVGDFRAGASLDKLILVDVADAPKGWMDNEQHFLVFQNEKSEPWWCSEPTRGRRADPREVFLNSTRLGPSATSDLLEAARMTYRRMLPRELRGRVGLPDSLRLIRVTMDSRLPPLILTENR